MKKLLFGILLFGLNGSVFAQENDSTIVFSDAVAMAQAALDSLGIEAVMLGGETYYDSFMDDSEHAEGEEFGFEDRSMGLRATGSAASVFGRPLAMSEHEGMVHPGPGPGPGMAMMPNGYSDWWSVYAYYTELDSVIAFEVGVEGVWDAYLFGEDEVEEEGIDFSLMQALPETYVDSDSAMVIAETYGGELFRQEYVMMDEEGFAGWEVELVAIHDYWSFPEVDPSEVPVMWAAHYIWSEVEYVWWDAGRVLCMDIVTGDTLFTERYVEEFGPEMPGILFSEAVALAQQALDSVGVSATILGGEMYFGSEMYYDDSPDGEEYGFNGTSLSSRMGELRVNSSSLSLPMVLGEHEHDSTNPGPGMMPMGYSDWWSVYAYDSSLDSVIVMDVSPEGVWDAYMIGEDEVEEEGIDFSLMQALPETYIDSDSAMILAEGYGGQMFRDEYSVMSEEEFAGWEVNLRAVHEYWSVPDEDPSAVPVMWVAEYYGGKMNMYGMGKLEMFAIYMDITTGDTLFTERYVEEFEPEKPGILFSEAVALAQQALDSVGVSATIFGGEMYFSSNVVGCGAGPESGVCGEYRLREAGPALVMGEHEADSVHPGPGPGMLPLGYSDWWSVYAYASDSVMALEVGPEGVMEVYILDAEDTEGIDVNVLKALPESYIDSDSALVLADLYGGQAFRDSYEMMSEDEFSYMEVGMTALHQYWVMEDTNPANVPVMWAVEYYGERVDAFGSGMAELYTIYMDISTGDTLFTERYVEEFEPEMPGILFSEAVDYAQQALDSAGVNAVILGGETSYDYSTLDLDISELELEHGIHLMPMGYSEWWNIYAYEPSMDSILVLEVEMDGVWEVYTVGEDDMDESIDFSILKALPEDYMDSNELMMMIAESDYDLENFMTDVTLPEHAYMNFSMDLRIIHDYWSFPIDLAPELIPVTWNMTLHGSLMDSLDQTIMSDSLSVYIHSTEGELLYASLDLTNSEQENTVPESVVLYQNYPNPFNPTTSISFELNKAQDVSLVVYNLLGQQVLTLVNDRLESGQHRINLNASNLASGIYMYRLTTNSQSLTKKMTLIK